MNLETINLCVVGLGYVGLPLAVEFSKQRKVVGFDVNEARIKQLSSGFDVTNEVSTRQLTSAINLRFTSESRDLAACNCFVVAVPTPIDKNFKPDLSLLASAATIVGQHLKGGDLVIFESTVFPGATEDFCAQILAETSGLNLATEDNLDEQQIFHLGYSPERINPGDSNRKLTDIVKVTSGNTTRTAEVVDELYSTIIEAGTHRAHSIKVAEAAKVIENVQRDVNIALMNELAMIFHRLDLDTNAILNAAATKWNFLDFRPGLVGGHCIGVDPHYLIHKAHEVGYIPQLIQTSRQINEEMANFVAERFVKSMLQKKIDVSRAQVLVLGVTFKENCNDTRNSKVVNLIESLQSFNCTVDAFDPIVDKDMLHGLLQDCFVEEPLSKKYDGILLAVPHEQLILSENLERLRLYGKDKHVFFDLKSALPGDVLGETL